jgi:hypothetical protein
LNQVHCVYKSGAYCYVNSCCISLKAKYLPQMYEMCIFEIRDSTIQNNSTFPAILHCFSTNNATAVLKLLCPSCCNNLTTAK